MTTPFSPRELVARIRAILRRPRSVGAPVPAAGHALSVVFRQRVFGPLSIDVAGRQVDLEGEPVTLTRNEFDILGALSSRPSLVWSQRQLIEAVWGEPWIAQVRRKTVLMASTLASASVRRRSG